MGRLPHPRARLSASDSRLAASICTARSGSGEGYERKKRNSHDGVMLSKYLPIRQVVGHIRESVLGASQSSLDGVHTKVEL